MDAYVSGQQHQEARITGGLLRWILVSAVVTLILAVGLFMSAGRLDWVMAWVYLGVLVTAQVVTAFIIIPTNPTLIAERSWMQEGSKKWDVLIVALGEVGLLAISVVAGLDARFGWSPNMPLTIHAFTFLIAISGYALFLWAMASNRFFSAYVRIQSDRGHTVTNAGPYKIVRHPGYVGGILLYLGIPMMLGSLWAFIPAGLLVCVTLIRTLLEDRTLQAELDGYTEYSLRVRYRLLPGVW